MKIEDTLTAQLENLAFEGGVDLFGIADLSPARDFIVSQGGTWLERFPRAISLGMGLSDLIVDQHQPHEPRRQSLYWHHVYNVVTPALDFLAYDLSRWLNKKSFSALPVPASTPYNYEMLMGIFSHKLAAHLAGLGWIGKSCLLVSKKYGPRVRFVSILTDAPLLAGEPLDDFCGKCHICVDTCPVRAFTGREFMPDEPREIRFQAFKCSEYRRDHPCGLCVSSCPQGKKSSSPIKTRS